LRFTPHPGEDLYKDTGQGPKKDDPRINPYKKYLNTVANFFWLSISTEMNSWWERATGRDLFMDKNPGHSLVKSDKGELDLNLVRRDIDYLIAISQQPLRPTSSL